jgi:signal peptidase I
MTTDSFAAPDSRTRLRLRGRCRAAFRLVLALAFISTVALWAVFLRPDFLGGRASYVIVSGTSMRPTLRTGDLVLALNRPAYRAGDVIAYHVPAGPGRGALIIHRIIGGSGQIGFLTKGDNRDGPDEWHPKQEEIAGRMVLHVPRAGVALAFVHTPLGLALLAALVAFVVLQSDERGGAPAEEPAGRSAPSGTRRGETTGAPGSPT